MAASGGRLIPLGRPDQNLRGGRVLVSIDRLEKRISNVDLLLAPSSCVVIESSKASSVECPSGVIWCGQIEDTPKVGKDSVSTSSGGQKGKREETYQAPHWNLALRCNPRGFVKAAFEHSLGVSIESIQSVRAWFDSPHRSCSSLPTPKRGGALSMF